MPIGALVEVGDRFCDGGVGGSRGECVKDACDDRVCSADSDPDVERLT